MNRTDDARLIHRCLEGDRDAFAALVERYQVLVCSLAYSACGSLNRSEDIAQETFLTAWRNLPKLRQPESFKSWLCGIARNLSHDSLRRATRNPTDAAEPWPGNVEPADPAPQPVEAAMSHEEEALLWSTLQRLPPNYREPLILFYREGRSIERVAHDLDLSVDAVKQRLSRGRTLLKNQLTAVIEGTLSGSIPTKAFTLGVIAALPAITATASAATLTASATKATATLAGSGAVLGLLGGILGGWLGAKASIENTHSLRERKFMVRQSRIVALLVLAFLGGLFSVIYIGKSLASTRPGLFAAMIIGLVGLYILLLVGLVFWGNHRQRRIRIEDGTLPIAGASPSIPNASHVAAPPGFEYTSRFRPLGLPLIHVNLGLDENGRQRHARGWIAIGNIAWGFLFAAGNVAVGGIAMGGLSFGLVSLAGLAAGGIAVGGVAAGAWAMGGFALGFEALGGIALAWQAAVGGLAVAVDYAQGGLAIAEHANDPTARAFLQSHGFLARANDLAQYSRWALILPAALILLLFFRRPSATTNPHRMESE